MQLEHWAVKNGVTLEALLELKQLFNQPGSDVFSGMGEGAVQSRIRLEAANKGVILWRNNVGAYSEKNPPSPGTRWGLANDSKQMNVKTKSSDLIGIHPVLITPAHVGFTIGQFVAREVKKGDWTYKGTAREKAQLNYLNIVSSYGGDAAFANSDDTL